MEKEKILEIKNLNVNFHLQKGIVRAVRDLDIYINKGETLALVGESGCGKSVTANSILQLIPSPPGKIDSGEIIFDKTDLLKLSKDEIRQVRGERISMIFQEPMTSLNPVFKIGDQIAEVYITHHCMKKKQALEKAVKMLEMVKIPAPEKRASSYPHQLSGGMRQRVMIAMALASPEPGLLIADEPTTALDVTIQAQILKLMRDLKEKIRMSLLLITHDMGVVAETADHVAVMYAGRKVEEADVFSIFEQPKHPYTIGLLNSMPSKALNSQTEKLISIPGTVPDLFTLGDGCPFANRCNFCKDICVEKFPEETRISESHKVFCHFHDRVS